MSKTLRILVFLVWVVAATLGVTRWWMVRPDMFPTLPEWLWGAFERLYGSAGCCEGQADFEAVVVFSISFVAVAVVSLVGWLIFRAVKRQAA